MEMMTPRKQDGQATVVQNLTYDRLLALILAEETGNKHEGTLQSRIQNSGREGSLGMDTFKNTVIASFHFSFANLHTFPDSLCKHFLHGKF